MNYFFLFTLFRRLRAPLISLIVVYSVSVLGFVLIPGVDDQGNPWRMDFFHAFYFVSFMGSTIGFGEIPYPFTDGQRMWTLVTIYATVITWLYGIGKMLALFQEPAFNRLMHRMRFRNGVERVEEPFYLVCGYGMTGSLVVGRLAKRGIRAVVVDIDRTRIDALQTDDLRYSPQGLCADAAKPDVLNDAGLQRSNCIGVLALTNRDEVNLAIAITSKLLAPGRPVVCRSESDVTTANLASFGTDHIIDPFVTYADYLALALASPYHHLVYDWLTNPTHRTLASAYQKTQGRWVICGYGRLGRALHRSLRHSAVNLTIIDDNPKPEGLEVEFVQGLGTEAVTLEEARIHDAVGLVAGTANDANNLSIVMTALELNPKLLTVVRQNLDSNAAVFAAAKPDLIMEPGRIIANNILSLIKSPLLSEFLEAMRSKDEVWAHTLVNRMSAVAGQRELDSWAFSVGEEETPALAEALNQGRCVKLNLFMKDPRSSRDQLPCFPLMLKRNGELKLLPGELTELQLGDQLLFCGLARARDRMNWTLVNSNVFSQVVGDPDARGGWLARRFRSWGF
ncbi:TrkA family potassium uptake protein [Motiliproteus sp. SC1-56]|uniref:potassium channel family protein n=1 Tax=Motiliproteus sp. SC1-56 TaxID=2799565 RepID=UPI001A8E3AA9|nr:NAD-binding protein [Motiliproteus sp. SC1-56]